MAKSFSILRNAMSSSAKAESEKMYREALASISLKETKDLDGDHAECWEKHNDNTARFSVDEESLIEA
jgi:hypothetical protein